MPLQEDFSWILIFPENKKYKKNVRVTTVSLVLFYQIMTLLKIFFTTWNPVIAFLYKNLLIIK